MRICIEGNIGSGKSSLLARLSGQYETVPEPVSEWGDLLHSFYDDPSEWGFVFNTRVLLDFARVAPPVEGETQIVERSPGACRHVFGQLLYNDGHLSPRAWDLFKKYADDLGWEPDLYVYVQAPPDVCLSRIAARNRDAEQNVTREYLSRIDFQYENMLRFTGVPVVRVDGTGDEDEVFARVSGIIDNFLTSKACCS